MGVSALPRRFKEAPTHTGPPREDGPQPGRGLCCEKAPLTHSWRERHAGSGHRHHVTVLQRDPMLHTLHTVTPTPTPGKEGPPHHEGPAPLRGRSPARTDSPKGPAKSSFFLLNIVNTFKSVSDYERAGHRVTIHSPGPGSTSRTCVTGAFFRNSKFLRGSTELV